MPRVDHDGERDRRLVRVAPVVVDLDHGDAQRHADLVGGDAGAVGVAHRVDEVADQLLDLRRGDVGRVDLGGALAQHRMADRDDRRRTVIGASTAGALPRTHAGTAGGPSARRPAARRRAPGTAATCPTVAARGPCRRRGSAPTAPAGGVRADAAGGVQRQHVEEHGVAGLELPADHPEAIRLVVDRRQLGERAVGEPLRLAVEERARHVPRPEVRAGDELERRLPGDRVDRQPHRGVEPPVDVVVRAGPGATACAARSPAP